MPGNFGTSPSADGGDAFTTSSANTGFFARNDATTPALAGSVGGNGVFGLSTVPNASGVFGANNNGGVGVAGNSDKGSGMVATTKSNANQGIFAANNATTPAPAGSVGGNGVFGLSTVPNASGVFGANNNGGVGVAGNSDKGSGMVATTKSNANQGIFAANNATTPAPAGSVGGNGVFGLSTVPNASGVFGANNNGGVGVAGNSDKGSGMVATTKSNANQGIFAANNATAPAPAGRVGGNGVFGLSTVPNASGVFGANNNGGIGVSGNSDNGNGMLATTASVTTSGIFGINNGSGSVPDGLNRPAGNGVWGHTKVEKGSGVVGSVEPGLQQAAGVTGIGPIAGHFFGNVIVTGDILLPGADCAEHFDIAGLEKVEPGTVMVINEDGLLEPSRQAYDKRVAGVISGAGKFKPGIVLGGQESDSDRRPIALVGKVYCKVDAEHSAIKVGDLLTTSPAPGHAMKAADPSRAFGSVIGKALRRLAAGRGLIPILVALQ